MAAAEIAELVRRVELGEAEQSILELEEQMLPRLRAEELAIRQELRQALLALEWKSQWS